MDPKNKELKTQLEGISHLLSHLHDEVRTLEESYSHVLQVLQKFEGAYEKDELTGLSRRRSFFRKWEALLEKCQALNENCGFLMIDIDHFKRVNDTHGHPTGDEVIKRVAGLLKQYESPRCVAGRYGGEEFAVAICGTDAEIKGIAEFIRRGAEKLTGPVVGASRKGDKWKCTLSVGVASANRVGFDADRLLRTADENLYRAKRRGRNRVAS